MLEILQVLAYTVQTGDYTARLYDLLGLYEDSFITEVLLKLAEIL